MKLNRRDFIKFFGKTVMVAPLAAILPELPKVDNPVGFEDNDLYEGGTIRTSGLGLPVRKIARWEGDTWADLNPADSRFSPLYINSDGIVYVGDEFTLP